MTGTAMAGAQHGGHDGFDPKIWRKQLDESFHDGSVLSAISNADFIPNINKIGPGASIDPTINSSESDKTLKWMVPDHKEFQENKQLMKQWGYEIVKRYKPYIEKEMLCRLVQQVSAKNQGKRAGGVSESFDLGASGTPVKVGANKTDSAVSAMDLIIDMGTVLDEIDAPIGDRFVVVSARLGNCLLKSGLERSSRSSGGNWSMNNCLLGEFAGFKIYFSNQMGASLLDPRGGLPVISGSRSGFSFKAEVTNIESMKVEECVGDCIKWHWEFGYEVMRPEFFALARVELL